MRLIAARVLLVTRVCRVLEAGAEIGERLTIGLAVLADPVHDAGLEPAEAEVGLVVTVHRARKLDGVRIAGAGNALDDCAARIAEAEDPGHLVQRLAGRVVSRAADLAVGAVIEDLHDRGVAARDGEGAPWGPLARRRAVEVDGRGGLRGDAPTMGAARVGDRGDQRDEERADEAGASGDGDAVDVVEGDAGGGQRLVEDGEHVRHVVAQASSGTTPPYFSWMATCDDTTSEKDARAILDDGDGCVSSFFSRPRTQLPGGICDLRRVAEGDRSRRAANVVVR